MVSVTNANTQLPGTVLAGLQAAGLARGDDEVLAAAEHWLLEHR